MTWRCVHRVIDPRAGAGCDSIARQRAIGTIAVMRLTLPKRGLRWYFDNNDGHLMHKWMHYLPIYERHFDPYRGRAVNLLEIGVSHGGSLQMWRYQLGRRATIVGVDIEERVRSLAEPGIELHVGDQSDAQFLNSLIEQYGHFDIVIDDGSHLPAHQIATLEHLWPHVAPGGVYLVEDLHSNYWADYGSARGHPDSFMTWLTGRIDDMHAFHSREENFAPNDWTRSVQGIHVYDSIAVLDKAVISPPTHLKSGRPAFHDVYGHDAEEMIDEQHREQLRSLSSPAAKLRRLRRDPVGTTQRVVGKLRSKF